MRAPMILAAIAVTACRGHDVPSREERAAAALARVGAIQPELAKLRGLRFQQPVPAASQTTDEFRAFVRREIAKDLPNAKAQSTAFAHLGFLREPVDLAAVTEEAAITQAGAYYDPSSKKFFLLFAPDAPMLLETFCAHELTHALQDQHFDLAAYVPPDLDDDAATARRFVVEGDATFTMTLYMVARAGAKRPTPLMLGMIRNQLEHFAAMDPAGVRAQTLAQSHAMGIDGDEQVQRAVDAMDKLPPIVMVPLLDSYSKGAILALVAYEQGGWDGVDALFGLPPRSTEEVLHPETKLYPTRDLPRRITLAPTGDEAVYANVFGELQWSIYFGLWTPSLAKDASEGWGGDRYRVVRRKDGRLVGEIATVWDTEVDAVQFESAYVASLAKRFPGAAGDAAHGVARPDGGKVFVRRDRDRVFIVDGADDASALDALAQGATIE